MNKWLSVVGIGEDGLSGLSPVARSLLDRATAIVGGDRHLAMLPKSDRREKIVWSSPIAATVTEIVRRRGQAVCVLASGDPMCYGIGVTLIRQIAIAEMTIVPAASAFSLACARLGWSLTDVETISLCGRDPASIQVALYPGARLLALSSDRQTPAIVADILVKRGWGDSQITVLERMGGDRERTIEGIASDWGTRECDDLNTIAILCIPSSPHLHYYSRLAGLPNTAYHHDGQITKREIRAATLAALAPLPGQLLWDVGAGCGSVGIEWMRSDPRCEAIAIEQHPPRLQFIANNAATLGTPNLKIIAGEAPTALKDLPTPDAIFIGGGLTAANLFETCWQALRSGGRIVVNAVTVEGEQKIFQWHGKLGGEITRMAVQRAEPVGQFLGWKAMAPVTQWTAIKQLI
jgi:precorrin-6B C5,15-methyltransferase / cobalt-precorrin-6B C5,C15-methyltransferase